MWKLCPGPSQSRCFSSLVLRQDNQARGWRKGLGKFQVPNICYWCGCFDHGDKDCDLWIQSKGTLQPTSQRFGSWIRANQSEPSKKNVFQVSGFYKDMAEKITTRRRREGRPATTLVPPSGTVNNPNKEYGGGFCGNSK